MMMFSDNTEDTTSPTEANCSLEELKENIQNDLDCLLGIYCEDNILESEPEIVQVAKHIFFLSYLKNQLGKYLGTGYRGGKQS